MAQALVNPVQASRFPFTTHSVGVGWGGGRQFKYASTPHRVPRPRRPAHIQRRRDRVFHRILRIVNIEKHPTTMPVNLLCYSTYSKHYSGNNLSHHPPPPHHHFATTPLAQLRPAPPRSSASELIATSDRGSSVATINNYNS